MTQPVHRRRRSAPGSGAAVPLATERRAVRALRRAIQVGGLVVLRREVRLQVYGTDWLTDRLGPVVIAANHSSHLDTPVLLGALPLRRRRRTAVVVPAGSVPGRVRRAAAGVAFATVPQEGEPPPAVRLLAAGWSVLVYPEGSRSPDGFLSPFQTTAADLAQRANVPIVPVGVRGTYAAMPRGRSWPLPDRSRVAVRYGAPITPAPAESPSALTDRVEWAVRELIQEDATSWWQTQRGTVQPVEPPPGSWRRVWQETEPPVAGRRPRPVRIWRD